MIKQANESDVPTIEEILLDAVNWLSKSGMQNTERARILILMS